MRRRVAVGVGYAVAFGAIALRLAHLLDFEQMLLLVLTLFLLQFGVR